MTVPMIPDRSIAALATAQICARAAVIVSVRATDELSAQWLAGEAVSMLADAEQRISTETAPATELRRVANEISGRYTSAKKAIETARAHCRSQLLAFKQRKDTERYAALQAAASTGASHEEIRTAVEATSNTVAGFQTRTQWTWEMTDATKVPREYWILDEDRLNREVRALGDRFAVPGFSRVAKQVGVLKK